MVHRPKYKRLLSLKPLILFIIFCPFSAQLVAQKNGEKEKYFLWDKSWQSTQKAEKAEYFARLLQHDDTTWQWDIYNFIGPIISSERYKDPSIKTPHGRQMFYRKSGYLDSSGLANMGRKHGDWYYYNDTGKAIVRKVYDNGRLISSEEIGKDSSDADDLKEQDEEESSFPGGIKGWQKYLTKNMEYPERAVNAKVMGNAIIQFEIDSKGMVQNPEICKSVEFSIDQEALKLIRKSPKWKPATQGGRHVRSYKKQPMHFRF